MLYKLSYEEQIYSQHGEDGIIQVMIDSILDPNKTLLEIGAGHGRDSLFFQVQGLKVTCIDLSPAMVSLCQQKGITAHIMDVVNLKFENVSFDAVYSLNSFLHLSKKEFPVALKNVCNNAFNAPN